MRKDPAKIFWVVTKTENNMKKVIMGSLGKLFISKENNFSFLVVSLKKRNSIIYIFCYPNIPPTSHHSDFYISKRSFFHVGGVQLLPVGCADLIDPRARRPSLPPATSGHSYSGFIQ